MKFVFVLLIFAGIAGSVYADYRWRSWMAARREERERNPDLRA